MGINDYFEYLSVGLPGDIERRKQYGDFDGAIRLIDRRLKENVPDELKKCMTVERELISRIDEDYPFDRRTALAMIRADIPDFTEEEFTELLDENKIDWIYINGEERYFLRFYKTLLKVYPEFASRAGQGADAKNEGDAEDKLLDTTIAEMMETGKAAYLIRLRVSVRIEDESFKAGFVRVHIPIPAKAKQIFDIRILNHTDLPCVIAPEDAEQRTICFETVLEENREFFVEYSYINSVEYVNAYEAHGTPKEYDFDVEEKPPHIMFTPYIKALVKSLAGHTDDPMEKARAFYDFITKNVKYSYMRAYFGLENIAENCARNLRGDCGVQALLFITLCRCAGIPARWQSCTCASPDSCGAHDWTQFFVEPYGWLFCDPSFGGGSERSGLEIRRRFYFGNLDPFRMVANREFQAPLMPDKKHWRADPYDNQSGEIEYEDKGLGFSDFDCERELVELRKL